LTTSSNTLTEIQKSSIQICKQLQPVAIGSEQFQIAPIGFENGNQIWFNLD